MKPLKSVDQDHAIDMVERPFVNYTKRKKIHGNTLAKK